MNWFRKQKKETEHRHFEEQLSAYLDGELLPREQEAVEQHLSTCPACRWHLKTLRQTVQWTSELPMVRVPRAFTIPVPARAAPAARRRGFLPVLQMATALVALFLFFVIAGDAMLTGFPLIGAHRAEPEMVQVEATAPVRVGGAEAGDIVEEVAEKAVVETVVETVEVEKEVELMAPEAPAEAAVEVEASPVAEASAEVEDSAAKEPPSLLAVAPAQEATVTAEAAMRATGTPAGMEGAVEEVAEEASATPKANVRALAPEPTVGMEAPTVLPMPTAVPMVEPQATWPATRSATRVAMPPPSVQVEGDEVLSVPEPAQAAERSYSARPTVLIWVRWGEYVLGVLLILLLGTTIGVMIWRWSRK